ncbi:MAG: tetratricopeptide repeat protein, partial [Anaerolineae bacterium]|nr:tetratricopeptide repeat protein [Anaerolineae bacterium]
ARGTTAAPETTGREYTMNGVVRHFYYDGLSRGQRQVMHERAAAYYEHEEFDALRAARHYERAGQFDRAVRLATVDVEAAIDRGQARTLHLLLARLAERELAAEQRASLDLALGQVLSFLGEDQMAQPLLERALPAFCHLDTTESDVSCARQRARVLQELGTIALRRREYAIARDYNRQMLELCRSEGNKRGEGTALRSLGKVAHGQGQYAEARVYFEQSLDIHRQTGDRREEGATLNDLGVVSDVLGEYDHSRGYYEQALRLNRQTHNRQAEGHTLNNLGLVSLFLGEFAQAEMLLQQSLHVKREIGDRRGMATTLLNLGEVLYAQAEYAHAETTLQRALDLCREVDFKVGEGIVLGQLGEVSVAQGKHGQARSFFWQALAIHRDLEQPYYAVEDWAGLARVALTAFTSSYGAESWANLTADSSTLIGQGLTQAQGFVAEILPYLGDHPALEGAEHPLRVMLTVYLVLRAVNNEQAVVILSNAYNLLQQRAGQISDPALRTSFLENVPEHREIVEIWEARR